MRPHVDLDENFELTALYTAFSARYGSDYYVSGEVHDFWELVIVTEGEIGVTAGKEIFYLKKGQAILHTPNEFHNLWSAKNTEAGILIFTFGARHLPLPAARIFSLETLDEPSEILQELRAAFEIHTHTVRAIREGCEASAAVTVKRLELFLLRLFGTGKTQHKGLGTSQSARNYAAVVRYLEEHLHSNLTVAEIARACNMGEVNLKKTFSHYAGMGIMSYFNRLKIHAAVGLLREGATVRECAESLGFLNQNYFSTVFKRIMGRSPKSFKE